MTEDTFDNVFAEIVEDAIVASEDYYPEVCPTRPCDECLSYGLHDNICSRNPNDPINNPNAPHNLPLREEDLDYVCPEHQLCASDCGCFDIDDWCLKCGGRKTSSFDGKHCRICNW